MGDGTTGGKKQGSNKDADDTKGGNRTGIFNDHSKQRIEYNPQTADRKSMQAGTE